MSDGDAAELNDLEPPRRKGSLKTRSLVLGGPWGENVLKSLAWTAGILVVFVPLAIKRYRSAG